MVVDFLTAKENLSGQSELENEESCLLNEDEDKESGLSGLAASVLRRLGDAYVSLEMEHSGNRKPWFRHYEPVSGYVCPRCASKRIGWVEYDYYPSGIPDYVIEYYPNMKVYRNKPYINRYQRHNALECMECNKVIAVAGAMLQKIKELSNDEEISNLF